MALPRDEWLARRNSPSIGRVLRMLERYKFIQPGTYYNRPESVVLNATAIKVGRNHRKRMIRSTKRSKKEWPVVL
jgi:hypothetical protein